MNSMFFSLLFFLICISVLPVKGQIDGLTDPNQPFSPAPVVTPSYAVLKKKPDGGFHLPHNTNLYFKYEGEYNQENIQYTIYNFRRQAIPCNLSTNVKVYGDNRYYIDLSSCPGLTYGTYMLEVLTEKKDIYYLKFKYQNNNTGPLIGLPSTF